MYQITTEEISQEIIDQHIPQEIKLREKLIRKINECYQWNSETYNQANNENYSFIDKALEVHIFNHY